MTIEKEKVCEPIKVKQRIQETADTVSLVLEIPTQLKNKFKYKAGQFVTVFMDLNGEAVRRSYSIPTAPEVDTELKISIKLVPGGKGSTHLVQNVKAGDTLWVTPPAGLFCLPSEMRTPHFIFFAAGSGITPIISLIKSALYKYPAARVALMYQNRNVETVIFRSDLDQLVAAHPQNFRLKNFYTQTTQNSASQRIDIQGVSEFLRGLEFAKDAKYFLCGPDGFMDTVKDALSSLHVSKEQVHFESFNTTPTTAAKKSGLELPADCILIGDQSDTAAPETIVATFDGETHVVDYQKDMTVLECLLEAGLHPPYSCLDGACMACMAKIEQGGIYQNDLGILTEDNVAAKECLTCQARPTSKSVKINYDP